MSTVLGVVWGSGIETGEIDHRRYPDLELETLGQECERTCVEFCHPGAYTEENTLKEPIGPDALQTWQIFFAEFE